MKRWCCVTRFESMDEGVGMKSDGLWLCTACVHVLLPCS